MGKMAKTMLTLGLMASGVATYMIMNNNKNKIKAKKFIDNMTNTNK